MVFVLGGVLFFLLVNVNRQLSFGNIHLYSHTMETVFYSLGQNLGTLSKVLERTMRDRLEQFILTSDNQFGFKPKHGTDMSILPLNQINTISK